MGASITMYTFLVFLFFFFNEKIINLFYRRSLKELAKTLIFGNLKTVARPTVICRFLITKEQSTGIITIYKQNLSEFNLCLNTVEKKYQNLVK